VSARQVLADLDGWTMRAKCRGASDRVFFPLGTPGKPAEDTHLAAKQLCASCPVTAQCLQRAMRTEGSTAADYRFGVFGGLDPTERHALFIEQAHARCTTDPAGKPR
jgi:WhiB family transcriptional regulator, redox-sensing transcriptional regulator